MGGVGGVAMTAGGEEGWHVMTLGGPGRGGRAGGPALSPLLSLTSCWSSPSPPPARCSLPPSHCRSPDRRSGGGSVSPCCREQAKGHPGAQGCQGAPTHPAPRTPFPRLGTEQVQTPQPLVTQVRNGTLGEGRRSRERRGLLFPHPR